jgi:hypothetical protein
MTWMSAALLAVLAATPPKGGAPAQPTPAAAVIASKRSLRIAVELCAPSGRCDPGSRTADAEYTALLKESQQKFLEACQRCAKPEACDAEAERIKGGKPSPGPAPCQ